MDDRTHADALLDSLLDLLVAKGVITENELYDRVTERLGAEDADDADEEHRA